MERTEVLDLMGTLKLDGMHNAYDEVMATAIKRQHEPPRIVGETLHRTVAVTATAIDSQVSTDARGQRHI